MDEGQKGGGDTELGQSCGYVDEGTKGRSDTELEQGSEYVDKGQRGEGHTGMGLSSRGGGGVSYQLDQAAEPPNPHSGEFSS